MFLRGVHMALLSAFVWAGMGLLSATQAGDVAAEIEEAPAARDPEAARLSVDIKSMTLPEEGVPTHPAQRLMLLRDQRQVNPYFKNGPTKWRDYCARQPADCTVHQKVIKVPLTPALWQSLQQVNQRVNAHIRYTPDPQNGQGVDKWVRPELADQPYVTGDCEDYVLAKRHALMQRGLPAGALRFTLVARGQSQHADHAVLVVATDFGDFVLDNVMDGIRPVEATSYRYVSMHVAKPSAPNRFRHTLPRPVPLVEAGAEVGAEESDEAGA